MFADIVLVEGRRISTERRLIYTVATICITGMTAIMGGMAAIMGISDRHTGHHGHDRHDGRYIEAIVTSWESAALLDLASSVLG